MQQKTANDLRIGARSSLLERTLDALAELYYVFTTGGELVVWNDRLSEVTGYSDAEVRAMEPVDFFEGKDREEVATAIAEVATHERSVTVEASLRTKDGESIPYEFSGTPVRDTDGDLFIAGLGRDITTRKERERENRKQREKYRRLTERISDGYFACDRDWTITYWNDVVARRQDIPPSEAVGETLWDLFPEIEGTTIADTFRSAMDHGKPLSEEYYHEPDDYWVRLQIYPDEDGIAVISRDITEQKEYEQKLEASNEKLEQFAYVASHDLQEPLRTVSSHLDLLEREYGDRLDGEAAEYVDMAVTAADRMQSMINGLLDYSRVTTRGSEFEQVDTEGTVRAVVSELQLLVEEHDGTVHVGDLPTVEGDPDQLGQLFQNLVKNALEHGGDSPTVRIEATETADGYRFAVADDGPGIDPSAGSDIFQLFESGQRDYESGEARGIGLAVCEQIVDRHGGDIRVKSEPGEGATFYVTL